MIIGKGSDNDSANMYCYKCRDKALKIESELKEELRIKNATLLAERLEITTDHKYEGIECRDETIRLLEKDKVRLDELNCDLITQSECMEEEYKAFLILREENKQMESDLKDINKLMDIAFNDDIKSVTEDYEPLYDNEETNKAHRIAAKYRGK